MVFTAEQRREYDRKRYETDEYKAKERDRWNGDGKRRKPRKPFIGVDGEGGSINGRHEYLLLRAGTHLLYRDSQPLRTSDILRWLCSLPRDGIYVGFGFDYDVSMILRDWPPDVLAQLFNRESRTNPGGGLSPVAYQGFLVEYLPRKHFRVARWNAEKPVYLTIHDTLGFYQSSFVEALETWSVGDKFTWDSLRAMKAKRSEFTEATMEEIEYNRQECILLADLTEALRDATTDAGLTIMNYEGAGCLAQAMLKKYGAPKRDEKVLPDVHEAARHAYYGGRFEISHIGAISPVHEYDLASAYPWAITQLPCLEHGRWVHEYQEGNPVQIVRLSWAISPRRNWGPFPFRDPDGRILYPSAGSGWYWGPEVNEELRMRDRLEVMDAWSWVPECEHRRFDWVQDIYRERQKIGKSGKGRIYKLGSNSLYGKFAQSVGSPQYASAIYAGLITSMVRAEMAKVVNKHGKQVRMIATDGIYLTREMKGSREHKVVEHGDPVALGGWEHEEFPEMFLIKPGIYFTNDGAKIKTRGVNRWQLDQARPELVAQWESERLNGSITLSRTQFIGARMAIAQNTPEKIGQWEERELQLSYASNLLKRNFDDDGTSVLWSREGHESTPYAKHFGVELQNELLWEDLDRLETMI